MNTRDRPPEWHKHLSSEQLQELIAFALAPGRTVDEMHEMVLATLPPDQTAGRTSVHSWMRKEKIRSRMSDAAEFALTALAAKDENPVDMIKSVNVQLIARVQHRLATASEEELSSKELRQLSSIGLNAGRLTEKVDELERRQADAVRAAQAAAKSGKSADAVVDTILEKLGISS